MAASIRKIGTETEVDRLLNKIAESCSITGFVEVGEDNFCLPEKYIEYEEKIRKFEVRDDDVFLLAHPKTGTTWCQEMIWLIVNNLDYPKAEKDIRLRFPLLEVPAYLDIKVAHHFFGGHPWEYINNTQSPRCLKSHLHWSLLPEQIKNGTKKPKIISCFRNPYDTVISYYHHCRLMEGYKGTLEDFAKLFLAGRLVFGPYWKSILSIWEQRQRPNVIFLKYKELKDDLPGVIRKVASFLEKPLTEEQVEKLANHLSFEAMKKNPAVNQERMVNMYAKMRGLNVAGNEFIRTGSVGGYKNVMSPELIEIFKKWEKENLTGTGLTIE